jgi:hypothetical protein
MDVVLGEGMTIASEDSQVRLTTADLRNGTHRIVGLNPEAANVVSGEILTFDVMGEGDVDFANIHFTTSAAQSFDFAFGGETTGISRLSTASADTVFDLNGRQLNGSKKGINIIRNAAGTKKVMK